MITSVIRRLRRLRDVDPDSLDNGDSPVWNSATGMFEFEPGGPPFSDDEPIVGQIPVWDGDEYVPTSIVPVVMSYETTPADHGMDLWAYNPEGTTNSTTASTGTLCASRMWVPTDCTITQLAVKTQAGGTGGTALANAYVALFDQDGVRLGVSANVATVWGDAVYEAKFVSLTEDFPGALSLTGGADTRVYAAYVLGQQSTTVLTLAANAQASAAVANTGLTTPGTPTTFSVGAIPNSFKTAATGLTSMPASIDMSAVIPIPKWWFGAK